MKSLLVCFCLLFGSFAFSAEQPLPAWQRENVLLAAAQIGMTREQIPAFKNHLFEFIDSYNKMVNKIYRREEFGLDRLIKSKRNRLLKKMDSSMAGMMDDSQYVGYENYRNLLLSEMGVVTKGAPAPPMDQGNLYQN